jgi:predicted enzyme related to lactoylglutathione lyase
MTKARAPRVFRLLLPATDLMESSRFYESLLGTRGRQVAEGRVYFDAGPVFLGLLDYSTVPVHNRPDPTEALYFATSELDTVHRRAKKLGCLDAGLIHNDPANPAGEVVVRPWGELSFYAHDPSGNSLCFVDESTTFTGTADQIAAMKRARRSGAGVRRSVGVARPRAPRQRTPGGGSQRRRNLR